MSRKKTLFSLAELLIVIAIFAVLLSLLFPSMQKTLYSSKVVSCSYQLQQITTAWHLYAGDYSDYYPDYSPAPEDDNPIPQGIARATIWALGKNSRGDLRPHLSTYLGDLDKAFVCPLQSPSWQSGKMDGKTLLIENKNSDGSYSFSNYPNEGGPYSTYNLYQTQNPNTPFFNTQTQMRQIGDRFVMNVGNANDPIYRKSFGIIASDLLYRANAYLNRMTVTGVKAGHYPLNETVNEGGLMTNLFTIGWDIPVYLETSFNFALDDGAVITYPRVGYHSNQDGSFLLTTGNRKFMFPEELAE